MYYSVHEAGETMDGDTTYTSGRKILRVRWSVVTCLVAVIFLLCTLCVFFALHPSQCHQQPSLLGSTETILDEIRGVDYERLESNTGSSHVRLPTSVVPDSYSIRIIPFLWAGNSTFEGQVDIIVNATVAVDSITLHAVDLNVTECTVIR